VILLLPLLIILSSCTRPEEIENPLIGIWKYMNYQTGDWEKITFSEDLTYRLENYNGTTYQTVIYSGTYTFDEEKFIFERRGYDDIAFYYEISGDNLIISFGKTYIRQ
jgi:hypothetical protein